MKKYFLILLTAGCYFSCEAQIPNKEQQIAEATQAAPPEKQAGATVLGYDDKGEVVILRKGSNELICIADDPHREGFNAACYHRDLDDFMKRGRELKAMGKKPGEIDEIREKEVQEGKLKMPDKPAALHVLYGTEAAYNPESGKVENAKLRYVVYMPYATAESTGLPLRPMVPGGAWLMDPGTHKAHIMVTPVDDN